MNITHCNIAGIRDWHILAIFQIIKLCPRSNKDTIADISFYIFNEDVLILLGSIRTHFQPQQAFSLIQITASKNYIMIIYRFATASQHSVTESKSTVFNDNITIATIIGILISPWSFAAF